MAKLWIPGIGLHCKNPGTGTGSSYIRFFRALNAYAMRIFLAAAQDTYVGERIINVGVRFSLSLVNLSLVRVEQIVLGLG